MLEGFPWVAKLLVILVGMAMLFFLILSVWWQPPSRRRRALAPGPRMVLSLTPSVRARVEDLRQRVAEARGEPCDLTFLFRMSLAALDELERREREGWRIIVERGDESEHLILFRDDDAEDDDGPVRTRWDQLNEGWLDDA